MSAEPRGRNLHGLGVGGWVVRSDGAVLLVRMSYGPADGRLMIPGGHADEGEFIEDTAVREVFEETGIAAVPRGILMVRQRMMDGERNLYLVFWMTPTGGELRPQLGEVSEAVWLTPEEILARDDIQPIAAELAASYRTWPQTCLARRELSWQDPAQYRLWAGQQGRPHDRE